MWYWIVMILLAVGSIFMLTVSFVSIKRRNDMAVNIKAKEERYESRDEDYGRTGHRMRQESRQERPRRKRRQWKIILEDIDSWDKYTFTFYDSVGIGRGNDGTMFEKYLPVMGDGRVSKVHCAIVYKDDSLYLRDEGSRNGTFLNGERIDRPVLIQRDDIIGIGETRLEVQRILRESEQ